MAEFQAILKLAKLPSGSMRTGVLNERELLICHAREGLFALHKHLHPTPTRARAKGGGVRHVW